MNYIQKQAALQKLAQVRLAINYVMRNRGMKKQAGEPQFGQDGYVDDKYKFLLGLNDALNPNQNANSGRVQWSTGSGKNERLNSVNNGLQFPLDATTATLPSPRYLAERLSKPVMDPEYLPPSVLNKYLPAYYNMYNGTDYDDTNPGIGIDEWGHGTAQYNRLPAWGIESIMNAKTPAQKVQAGQNWALEHGGKVKKW